VPWGGDYGFTWAVTRREASKWVVSGLLSAVVLALLWPRHAEPGVCVSTPGGPEAMPVCTFTGRWVSHFGIVVPRDGWGAALAIGAALLVGFAAWTVMNRMSTDHHADTRRSGQ
jgi:hypothetical protein